MNYIGISSGFHDAALSIIDTTGNVTFAAHSERYTKIKHDKNLSTAIIYDSLNYITSEKLSIHYYEKPWLKFIRQIISGEDLNLKNLNVKNVIGKEYLNLLTKFTSVKTHHHHLSHAAAGFQTSPFDKSIIVVIDAIGELDTTTIWAANYDKNGCAKYKLLWKKSYPNSIGLFYSAFTDRVGLKPLDEEYILMGMAGWGKSIHTKEILDYTISDVEKLNFKKNLHKGIDKTFLYYSDKTNIAASTQKVVESLIDRVMKIASSYGYSNNLVYMGGVALNCLANRNLGKYFDNIWIMPNPGDAGSSLGAAALGYGKKINWKTAFLGFNIDNPYPVKDIVDHLLQYKIAGVANGRAEFGPRALGNRSLLADPRGNDIKDEVNKIKRRQKFRPFAPVILEEFVDQYFEIPYGWKDTQYMQVVGKCKFPNKFPAIVHVDRTSRIQTVPKNNSGIRSLLEYWFEKTGCPMLLNTSLNIRGEPMVNDREDADRFEKLYGVKVFS